MDITALVIFATALLMAAGSPGPSIVALVARVLARGWRDVAPFLVAMWLGEIVWLTLTIAGLAVIAEKFHLAFTVIKYCGVVYLLYLAWKMWTAVPEERPADAVPERRGHLAMFFAGLTVTLGNPKIMVFYLALLPTIIDLNRVSFIGWAELCLTALAVMAIVDLGYVVLAARARRLLTNPKAMRIVNRGAATAMGGAAVAIAAR
jgi:threonine/homoserine/homoserine lactone efflux protein